MARAHTVAMEDTREDMMAIGNCTFRPESSIILLQLLDLLRRRRQRYTQRNCRSRESLGIDRTEAEATTEHR